MRHDARGGIGASREARLLQPAHVVRRCARDEAKRQTACRFNEDELQSPAPNSGLLLGWQRHSKGRPLEEPVRCLSSCWALTRPRLTRYRRPPTRNPRRHAEDEHPLRTYPAGRDLPRKPSPARFSAYLNSSRLPVGSPNRLEPALGVLAQAFEAGAFIVVSHANRPSVAPGVRFIRAERRHEGDRRSSWVGNPLPRTGGAPERSVPKPIMSVCRRQETQRGGRARPARC
jgi:hypothetical protein